MPMASAASPAMSQPDGPVTSVVSWAPGLTLCGDSGVVAVAEPAGTVGVAVDAEAADGFVGEALDTGLMGGGVPAWGTRSGVPVGGGSCVGAGTPMVTS